MTDEPAGDKPVNPIHTETDLTSQAAAHGCASTSNPGQAMKHRARREFDGWARTYDESVVQHLLFQPAYHLFMEELYRWRRDILGPFDLLDIGSGTGTWTAMVAGSAMQSGCVIGLDYSEKMCAVARGKGRQISEGAPEFVNADAEHLPFPDDSFDVVTCSHSFHHYPHQAATVREMYRVLRPRGRLMLIDGFRDNMIGWVVFDVFITRGESTPEAKVYHPSWKTMRQYFVDAGFKDIRQRKTSIWAPIFLTIGVV